MRWTTCLSFILSTQLSTYETAGSTQLSMSPHAGYVPPQGPQAKCWHPARTLFLLSGGEGAQGGPVRGAVSYERGTPVRRRSQPDAFSLYRVTSLLRNAPLPPRTPQAIVALTQRAIFAGVSWYPPHALFFVGISTAGMLQVANRQTTLLGQHEVSDAFGSQGGEVVGSEVRRGRWGTPTMALHIRIQHRE